MPSNDLLWGQLPLTLPLDEIAAQQAAVVRAPAIQDQGARMDGPSQPADSIVGADPDLADSGTTGIMAAAGKQLIVPQIQPLAPVATTTQNAIAPTATEGDAPDAQGIVFGPKGAEMDLFETTFAVADAGVQPAEPTVINGTAVGSPAITSAASTFALHGGFYSAFADLAQAAYALDESELTGLGKNFAKPYADDAMARVGSLWNVLSPAELGFSVDASQDAQGLNAAASNSIWRMGASGIYYCDNAAAYAAVCNDALVISFRGTNDNDTGHLTPDEANWLDMTGHYDELRAFIEKVDDYVTSNTTITKVYVTGHSLGGAMALGYMTEHPAVEGARVSYEAVTFAAPGYIGDADTLLGLSALEGALIPGIGFVNAIVLNLLATQVASLVSFDDRIIGIEINGDVVPDLKFAQGRTVSVNPIGLTHTISVPDEFNAGDRYGWSDLHTMNLYAAAAKSLDAGLRDTAVSTTSTVHGFDRTLFSPNDNALLGLSLSVAITEQFPDPAAVDALFREPFWFTAAMKLFDTEVDAGEA